MAGHNCGLMDKVTSDPKIEGLNPFVVFGGAFFFLKIIFRVTEVMNGGGAVSLKESSDSLFCHLIDSAAQQFLCRTVVSHIRGLQGAEVETFRVCRGT